MTRQREIPSIQYRSPNMINMTFPMDAAPKIRVAGAARLVDAYGAVAGVGGGGTLPMFDVLSGMSYLSPSIRSRRMPAVEETSRGLTRMVFDPDDFSTAAAVPGGPYLPTDDQTLFLRMQIWDVATATYLPEGPIMIVPPYDFFTTKEPTFTVSGRAPNMALGAWPAAIPDSMMPGTMNFMVPGYSTTVSIANLDPGKVLFVSFHPGMPPTVILPGKDISMTGSGIPELFFGCPDGNPWFTVRIAVVNSA